MSTGSLIEMRDCPNCGVYQIRSTVRVCDVCQTSERYEAEVDKLRARVAELESLFQKTHGVHCSWVERVSALETENKRLREGWAAQMSAPCPVCIRRCSGFRERGSRGGEAHEDDRDRRGRRSRGHGRRQGADGLPSHAPDRRWCGTHWWWQNRDQLRGYLSTMPSFASKHPSDVTDGDVDVIYELLGQILRGQLQRPDYPLPDCHRCKLPAFPAKHDAPYRVMLDSEIAKLQTLCDDRSYLYWWDMGSVLLTLAEARRCPETAVKR